MKALKALKIVCTLNARYFLGAFRTLGNATKWLNGEHGNIKKFPIFEMETT